MSLDCNSSSAGIALREASQNLAAFAIEREGVKVMLDRRRQNNLAIDDKMQIGVPGNRVAETLGTVEQLAAEPRELRRFWCWPRRALAEWRPGIVGVESCEFCKIVKAATVVALDIAFRSRTLALPPAP